LLKREDGVTEQDDEFCWSTFTDGELALDAEATSLLLDVKTDNGVVLNEADGGGVTEFELQKRLFVVEL